MTFNVGATKRTRAWRAASAQQIDLSQKNVLPTPRRRENAAKCRSLFASHRTNSLRVSANWARVAVKYATRGNVAMEHCAFRLPKRIRARNIETSAIADRCFGAFVGLTGLVPEQAGAESTRRSSPKIRLVLANREFQGHRRTEASIDDDQLSKFRFAAPSLGCKIILDHRPVLHCINGRWRLFGDCGR